jgi:hypothetical protein
MIEHFAIGVAIGAGLTWLALRLARRNVPDEPDYGLRDPYPDALGRRVSCGCGSAPRYIGGHFRDCSLLFCEDCGPVADVGHHPDCRRAAA